MMPFKNVFTGLIKQTVVLAVLATIIVIPFLLFLGFAAAVKFLYPVFYILAGASLAIFVIFILPLSLLDTLRPKLAVLAVALSKICRLTIWLYSFLVVVNYLGWLALCFIFIFHTVIPIAVIGLFLKEEWTRGGCIIAGFVLSYLMRFYGLWLQNLSQKRQQKIIDAVVVSSERIN
ncbi:MAG: hypothetical protein V1650_04145 [Candidatus Omnitrophota bacterium]